MTFSPKALRLTKPKLYYSFPVQIQDNAEPGAPSHDRSSIMVPKALGKPGMEEVAEIRALKRVKRTHLYPHPSPFPSPHKENKINVEELETKNSQSSASPTVHIPDGRLDHTDPNDEAVKEHTRTGKYNSSIYVDAFNLALNTVLQDELHLFSYAEQEVFAKYRSLEYEPQFLYTIHHHMLL